MQRTYHSLSERSAEVLPSVLDRRKETGRLRARHRARTEERLVALCDRTIEGGLIFLIIFTPLAFGTVHLWSVTVMELVVALLVILWMVEMLALQGLKKDSSPAYERLTESQVLLPVSRLGFVKTPLNLPILLFIALILVQLTPLPPPMIGALSKNTYKLYAEFLPYPWPATDVEGPSLAAADERKQERPTKKSSGVAEPIDIEKLLNYRGPNWRTLSIYPHATKMELFRVLAYAAVFFLLVNNLRTKRQLNRLVKTIIGVGFFVSLLGILQYLSGTEKIYWLRDASYTGPFGSYINRNHFAGYIGMVIPLALGYLVTLGKHDDAGPAKFSPSVSFLEAKVGHISKRLTKREDIAPKRILLTFIIIVMCVALFLSLSRGGIVAFVISMVFLAFLLRSRRSMRRHLRSLLPIALLIVLGLVWLGIQPVIRQVGTLSRIEKERSAISRAEVWQDTFQGAKDFLILGTGLGTYQHIFPKYRNHSGHIRLFFRHAHNDYLELLFEVGLLGFIVLLWCLYRFFKEVLISHIFGGAACYQGRPPLLKLWRKRNRKKRERKGEVLAKRHNSYVVGITLGALTAVVGLMLHSFVDFNIHIPTNALLLTIISSVALAAVHMKRQEGRFKEAEGG